MSRADGRSWRVDHTQLITIPGGPERPSFNLLAVVGAGNMGSGIAQKMATEGFSVVPSMIDEKVGRGLA